jgi:hypothetical protein
VFDGQRSPLVKIRILFGLKVANIAIMAFG